MKRHLSLTHLLRAQGRILRRRAARDGASATAGRALEDLTRTLTVELDRGRKRYRIQTTVQGTHCQIELDEEVFRFYEGPERLQATRVQDIGESYGDETDAAADSSAAPVAARAGQENGLAARQALVDLLKQAGVESPPIWTRPFPQERREPTGRRLPPGTLIAAILAALPALTAREWLLAGSEGLMVIACGAILGALARSASLLLLIPIMSAWCGGHAVSSVAAAGALALTGLWLLAESEELPPLPVRDFSHGLLLGAPLALSMPVGFAHAASCLVLLSAAPILSPWVFRGQRVVSVLCGLILMGAACGARPPECSGSAMAWLFAALSLQCLHAFFGTHRSMTLLFLPAWVVGMAAVISVTPGAPGIAGSLAALTLGIALRAGRFLVRPPIAFVATPGGSPG